MWQIIAGIVSGLVSPISNYLTKKGDVSLEKFKVAGQVDTSLIAAHVALERSKNDLRHTRALQILILAFGLPLAFYYGKIHVYDAALHLGSTDAIKGEVALWDKMVISFLFGASALAGWSRRT